MPKKGSTIISGVAVALLAALCFGLTTPIIARAGRGLGAFSTAALLYAGACLSAVVLGRLSRSVGAPMRRVHLGRLVAISVAGAGVAPTLFAWGLQQAGPMTGSLLLNLEGVFTVLLAWLAYREPVGRQIVVALCLMSLGGIALTLDNAAGTRWSALGALAIAGATAAWALDNTLTRGLVEQDPVHVVASKGALGAVLTGGISLALREPLPEIRATLILLACGATGYGLSLRLYLLAQRRIGAARTGSVFSVAPFVGAAAAWGIGDRALGPWTVISVALLGAGVLVHMAEKHSHRHEHLPIEHEHPHRHDDGHHDHAHDAPIVGEHSHVHRHSRIEHDHEHAPDVHHDHVHGRRRAT